MGRHSSLVGGSTATRVINCTASVEENKNLKGGESEFAARGTLQHEVIEIILREDVEPQTFLGYSYSYVNKEGVACVEKITQELLDNKVIPAVEWFDSMEFREVRFEEEVNFANTIPEGFGTVDVTYQGRKYAPEERGNIDWKFGDGVPVPAADNNQMRFYLAAAVECGLFNAPYEDEVFRAWIYQPSERADPARYADYADYPIADLDAFTDKLIVTIEAAKNNPTYKIGDWCGWCPANEHHTCPALHKQLTAHVGTKLEGMPSAERMEELLEYAYLAVPWAEQVKAMSKRMAEGGVVFKDFKLIKNLGHRTFTDEKKAAAALRRVGASTLDIYPKKIITPAKADAILKAAKKKPSKSYLDNIVKPDRGLALVRASAKGDPVLPVAGAMDLLSAALKKETLKRK